LDSHASPESKPSDTNMFIASLPFLFHSAQI
jgi:hypothetical protein